MGIALPLIGVSASQISGHLYSPTGSYTSIQTATVTSGGTGTISFTSIPSTYKHLELRCFVNATRSASSDGMILTLNGDGTFSNYARHAVGGDGSASYAWGNSSTNIIPMQTPAASSFSSTNPFGALIISILDYTNTNKYKTVRALGGYDANGSGDISLRSGLYIANTNAINRLDVYPGNGSGWNQNTVFALYGIN